MISMLLEILNPYEICFGKTITKIKKYSFPSPWLLITIVFFTESPKLFAQSLCTFFDMAFTGTHIKREMPEQLLIKQTETKSRSYEKSVK